MVKYLALSMRGYCRSIELCEDYLRGYYGLKLVRASATFRCQSAVTNMSDSLPKNYCHY